jgi:hypothetical protein
MLHPIRHNPFEKQELTFVLNSAVTVLKDSDSSLIVKGIDDS